MSEGRRRMPRKYLLISEAASDRDKEWFGEHPGASYYVRAYVPGELGPQVSVPQDAFTVVLRVHENVRMRGVAEDLGQVPSVLRRLRRMAEPLRAR